MVRASKRIESDGLRVVGVALRLMARSRAGAREERNAPPCRAAHTALALLPVCFPRLVFGKHLALCYRLTI